MMQSLIERLAKARGSRTSLKVDDALTDFGQAYPISLGVMKALGESVGGWKVGLTADDKAIAAPMYQSGFIENNGRFALKPGRAMIPEVEIAVRLARDLPPGKTYTRDDMLDAAAELLLGFELIERRPEGGNGLNPLNLADDLGNVGYVIGPGVKEVRKLDLASLRCQFWMGDALVTDRRGGHVKGDPLVPMLAWANQQCDLAGGMKAGQVITLGSLTPMKAVEAPMKLTAELEGFGRICVDLT